VVATINELEARLNTHEEVCALRYEGINARLKRLETILIGSAGAIILLLLSLTLKV
jgi:hypothetical protein